MHSQEIEHRERSDLVPSVYSVDRNFLDPSESSGKFIATTPGVEESENVHTEYWVEAEPLVIKTCLAKQVKWLISARDEQIGIEIEIRAGT